MHERVDAVLDRLDEMNNGEISYEVYRELHDLVSMIPDPDESPTNLPTELFPGTQDALNALTIRDAEPDEWTYRARLASCSFLVDGYVSAATARAALVRALDEHPFYEMDETLVVERALSGQEGDSDA